MNIASRVGALAAVALLVSCGGSSHTVKGTLTLISAENTLSGSTCAGGGGFDDLRQGAAVVVSDETSKILATSQLDAGRPNDRVTCVFGFQVSGVPDANFYQVEVSHRGKLTYSKSEMKSPRLGRLARPERLKGSDKKKSAGGQLPALFASPIQTKL